MQKQLSLLILHLSILTKKVKKWQTYSDGTHKTQYARRAMHGPHACMLGNILPVAYHKVQFCVPLGFCAGSFSRRLPLSCTVL